MRSPAAAADIPMRSESYDACLQKPKLAFSASENVMRHVVTITNPDDIYEIAQYSRERDLHLLIRRYVNQILYGCQNPLCATPTCLSYQKRVAKGPLRKYTPLSARTLACFLISERDPEAGLCRNPPALPLDPATTRRPRKSRDFEKSSNTEFNGDRTVHVNGTALPNGKALHPGAAVPSREAEGVETRAEKRMEDGWQRSVPSNTPDGNSTQHAGGWVSKDPKSFTQSLFDTISLRMLEWIPLRPRSRSSDHSVQREALHKSRNKVRKIAEENASTHVSTRTDTSSSSFQPRDPDTDRDKDYSITRARDANSEINAQSKGLSNGNVKYLATSGTTVSTAERPDSAEEGLSSQTLLDAHVKVFSMNGSPAKKVGRAAKPYVERQGSDAKNAHSLVDQDGYNTGGNKSLSKPIAVHSLCLLTEPILEDLIGMTVEVPSRSGPRTSNSGGSRTGTRPTEREKFIRQSFFLVLKDPVRIIRSFCPVEDIDMASVFRSAAILYDLGNPDDIHQHLWQGLQRLQISYEGRIQRPVDNTKGRGKSSSRETDFFQSGTSPKNRFFSDADAAKCCAFVVCVLSRWTLPSTVIDRNHDSDMDIWGLFGKARAQGLIFHNTGSHVVPSHILQSFVDLIDKFDDELAVRLVEQFVTVINSRLAYYEISKSQKHRGKLFLEKATRPANILQLLLRHIAAFRKVQHQLVSYEGNYLASSILERVRALFLRDWDGKATANRASNVGGAVQILAAMFEDKNNLGLISDDFVTPVLSDRLDPMDMPVEWLLFPANNKTLHLLSYSFLFPPAKVVTYFRAINFAAMSKSFESAMAISRHVQGMAFRGFIPLHNHLDLLGSLRPAMATYLVLQVRRDNVLTDAIDQLWRRERRELLRPLKVRMGMDEGEEGVDHGGVQQEFFRVVFAEALNADIGMFTVDPRTRMTWFQPGCPEPLYKYEILGVLMSLAVYNSITLPVTFPVAFYRKLLGLKVKKLDHIGDGWPELTRGLQDLLEWSDGDVGDIFLRTYEFTYEFAGQQISVDMEAVGRDQEWPLRHRKKGKGKAKSTSFDFSSLEKGLSGSSIRLRHSAQRDEEGESSQPSPMTPILSTEQEATNPAEASLVTNENRTQYVKDYIFWLADKSIRPQYEAFARGFYTCLDRTALSIFTPEALKSVIEGIQEIDLEGLKQATRYEDGFEKDDPYIHDFWTVVESLSTDQQRQLLEFVTASDRVPVNGVKSIMFVIQRNGDSDTRLPTSMTCFGRLLLPQYSNREVLREKLVKAIENSKGFGAA